MSQTLAILLRLILILIVWEITLMIGRGRMAWKLMSQSDEKHKEFIQSLEKARASYKEVKGI